MHPTLADFPITKSEKRLERPNKKTPGALMPGAEVREETDLERSHLLRIVRRLWINLASQQATDRRKASKAEM